MLSNKEQKYDRQLRLWGDNGQECLERASICLLGANATGCEILKNLILPGVGSIIIVDSSLVMNEDLGNNFFLTAEDLSKNRGAAVLPRLMELNEDVSGEALDESVDKLLENSPQFFTSFKLVIVSQVVPTSTLHELSKKLWDMDIPMLVCFTVGLWGFLHLSIREHCIIQSHPDFIMPDLRLDIPFQELSHFCDSQRLQEMDHKAHSHTPWLIILMKYVEKYKDLNGGKFPSTSKEKTVVKEWIRSGMWQDSDGKKLVDEENFCEAISAMNTALVPTRIPSSVSAILSDERVTRGLHSPNDQVRSFWILVNALKSFVDNEGKGQLPLSGSLPDMTSDSERYIALQRLYQTQAELHFRIVESYVDKVICSLPQKYRCVIPSELIKLFCKNAAHLRVLRNPAFHEVWSPDVKNIVESLAQSDCCQNNNDSSWEHDGATKTSLINEDCWYLAFRSAAELYSSCHHWPGVVSSDEDSFWMRQWCLGNHIASAHPTKTKSSVGSGTSSPTSSKLQGLWDCINEVCRCSSGGALHPSAAFMGGVAAQEAIKVITRQYVPIERPVLYNAMQHTVTPLTFYGTS